MFALVLICSLVVLFQPLCETLFNISPTKMEVSGNSIFVEKKLLTIISANFIHDGLTHKLYNILTIIPLLYSLESHFKLSFLSIITVILLCGICGFLCSIYYNRYKHGKLGYFIPLCGFSHSLYGIAVFMSYLYPYENQSIKSFLLMHPLIWILITLILPDFFSRNIKHRKIFCIWMLMCYLFLVICWTTYKILDIKEKINSSLYLFLFDISFIKSKLYWRYYLGVPGMCDHAGHIGGILSGFIIATFYNLININKFDIFLELNHLSIVLTQWPLLITILFALYRLIVNW